MEMSIFITAIAIAVCYLIFRFIEMRFLLKENKPLKVLIRDTLIVYLSVLLGNFILEQIGLKSIVAKVPQVFTNEPDF
jgi:RsiW-degrading membrane proteinase PrsW (M82 family)